ncbi:transposase [Rhizobium sp. PL01]|uniref:transposase n=1 Tax=Rhizobium sp. PL01 TaxID=3085631 RepID=UPI0039928962
MIPRLDARHDIGYDAGKKKKGRKRHILVDTLGMLLKAEVHSAGIQDRDEQLSFSTSSPTAFPLLRQSAAMAAIRVQRSKRQARDQWRSSSATGLGSRCCRSAGSLSARMHGLA